MVCEGIPNLPQLLNWASSSASPLVVGADEKPEADEEDQPNQGRDFSFTQSHSRGAPRAILAPTRDSSWSRVTL